MRQHEPFALPNLIFAIAVAILVGVGTYALQYAGVLAARLFAALRARAARGFSHSIGRSPMNHTAATTGALGAFTTLAVVSIFSVATSLGMALGSVLATMVGSNSRRWSTSQGRHRIEKGER